MHRSKGFSPHPFSHQSAELSDGNAQIEAGTQEKGNAALRQRASWGHGQFLPQTFLAVEDVVVEIGFFH